MSHHSGASQPRIIDTPQDFPVNWENPADAQIPWQQQAIHFPDPVTPMDYHFVAHITNEGFAKCVEHYHLPMARHICNLNTYVYTSMQEMLTPSLPEGGDGQKIQATMGMLGELWQREWLPEIKEHLAYWESFDWNRANWAALRTHLDETERRTIRLAEIHFRLALPMLLALTSFEEMYQDLIEDASQLDAYTLLTDIENESVGSTRELWKLSRKALADPWVRSVLETNSPEAVMDKLSGSVEGKAFLSSLNAYLQAYGHRTDKLYVSFPTWNEDPTAVIQNLKIYMTQPDRDLVAEMDEIAARRERSVDEARSRLAAYPKPIVDEFEFLLKAAQEANFLREEHPHWLEFHHIYHARQVLLACGRCLHEARVLETQEDVFYLTFSELRETMASALPESRQRLVRERRAKEAHFARISPPPKLGVPRQRGASDHPMFRAFAKVFSPPPPPSQNPTELLGLAGSSGIVRGTAKVLHSLDQVGELEPGNILVTVMTMASWTPIFANIAGLVTDAGGILSHPAVVAREYGIPAVVGSGKASKLIKDGQLIEVNGNTGVVRLL